MDVDIAVSRIRGSASPEVLLWGSSCVLARRCFPQNLWHKSPTVRGNYLLLPKEAKIRKLHEMSSSVSGSPNWEGLMRKKKKMGREDVTYVSLSTERRWILDRIWRCHLVMIRSRSRRSFVRRDVTFASQPIVFSFDLKGLVKSLRRSAVLWCFFFLFLDLAWFPPYFTSWARQWPAHILILSNSTVLHRHTALSFSMASLRLRCFSCIFGVEDRLSATGTRTLWVADSLHDLNFLFLWPFAVTSAILFARERGRMHVGKMRYRVKIHPRITVKVILYNPATWPVIYTWSFYY